MFPLPVTLKAAVPRAAIQHKKERQKIPAQSVEKTPSLLNTRTDSLWDCATNCLLKTTNNSKGVIVISGNVYQMMLCIPIETISYIEVFCSSVFHLSHLSYSSIKLHL